MPIKGRRLAMRSYSLSFQPSTAAASSPPIARWTPTSLEAVPVSRGETLPKVKIPAANPSTVLATVTNKSSPARKRTAKSKKASKTAAAARPRGHLPVTAVTSNSSSSAELEIERFEREFLQPLQQQQQQLARQLSTSTAGAAAAAEADANHHRDLRYEFFLCGDAKHTNTRDKEAFF